MCPLEQDISRQEEGRAVEEAYSNSMQLRVACWAKMDNGEKGSKIHDSNLEIGFEGGMTFSDQQYLPCDEESATQATPRSVRLGQLPISVFLVPTEYFIKRILRLTQSTAPKDQSFSSTAQVPLGPSFHNKQDVSDVRCRGRRHSAKSSLRHAPLVQAENVARE